jgi:iron complex outermembrane receptor protein
MNRFSKPIVQLRRACAAAVMACLAVDVSAQQASAPPAPPAAKDAVVLDSFVVTALAQQLALAAEAERQAPTIKAVLTADDLGNFPDTTLAESLARLPGVTVEDDDGEGRYVNIRGMPKEFNMVTINNAQLGSSADGGGRQVALDVVPGDLFQQLELGKTLLPDTDADSFGAKIDLRPLSAFSRPPEFVGRLSLRGNYGDLAEKWDQSVRANFSKQFKLSGDNRWGVAAAMSYEIRTINGDNLGTDSGGSIRYARYSGMPASQPSILVPQEFDQRIKRGERKRIGGTLVFDWENKDLRLQFSSIYGKLHDDNFRVQQEVQLRDASDSEIVSLEPGHGVFSDVDLERQMAFFGGPEYTYALHLEGGYRFGAARDWTLAFGADYSKNKFTAITEANRGRWAETDATVEAWWGKDYGRYKYLGRGDLDSGGIDYRYVPTRADFEFGQHGMIEEDRGEEISAYNVDLDKRLRLAGRNWKIKGGVKQRERERFNVRGELFVTVAAAQLAQLRSAGYPVTLDTVPTFVPKTTFDINGGIPGGAVFPELDWVRKFLADTRPVLGITPRTLRVDYNAREDVDAAYLMTSVNLLPKLELIAGARFERTGYRARGLTNTSIDLDRRNPANPTQVLRETLVSNTALTTYRNTYENWLPGVHVVWNAREDMVARFSYSKGQVRPSWGDANALVTVNSDFVERGTPGDNSTSFKTITVNGANYEVSTSNYSIQASGGNPLLKATTADQFDANVGWYPNRHSNVTLAGYYKKLKGYVVDVNTSDPRIITQLGGSAIDPLSGFATTQFNKTVNASDGELYGAELSGRWGLANLPGFLRHIILSGNAAVLAGSTSTPFINGGKKFDLPGMADFTGNVAAAYETKRFSLQVSTRYRSERIRSVSDSEPWRSTTDAGEFRLGASVRYDLNRKLRVFANVQNLTNELSVRYHTGDAATGRIFRSLSDFGRTWQVGMDARF